MFGPELLIAGTLLSMYGAYYQNQQKAQGLRQQAVARERQAEQSYLSGEREARLTLSRGERFQGKQIAAMGQSGAAVISTSNLLALEDAAANFKEEAYQIRAAAKYKQEVYATEAGYDRMQADQLNKATFFNIAQIGMNSYNKLPSDAPRSDNFYATDMDLLGDDPTYYKTNSALDRNYGSIA